MIITDSYLQNENETLIVDSTGIFYLVGFNVIKETIKGTGFIDYDTPNDQDQTATEIEIVSCFICNDDLENMATVNAKDEQTILEYLTGQNEY